MSRILARVKKTYINFGRMPNMKLRAVTNFVLLLLAYIFISLSLTGCNTFYGAGKDIERGGEAIQDAAD
jgi:predicted small secreted protein